MALIANGKEWIIGRFSEIEFMNLYSNDSGTNKLSFDKFCEISTDFEDFFQNCDNHLFTASPSSKSEGIIFCLANRDMSLDFASDCREIFYKKITESIQLSKEDLAEIFAFACMVFTAYIIKDDEQIQKAARKMEDGYANISIKQRKDGSIFFECEDINEEQEFYDPSQECDEEQEFCNPPQEYIDDKQDNQDLNSFVKEIKKYANNLDISYICFTTKDRNNLRFFLQNVKLPIHVYLDNSVYYVFIDINKSYDNELSSSMFAAFEAEMNMEPHGKYITIREHKKELSKEVIEFLIS